MAHFQSCDQFSQNAGVLTTAVALDALSLDNIVKDSQFVLCSRLFFFKEHGIFIQSCCFGTSLSISDHFCDYILLCCLPQCFKELECK